MDERLEGQEENYSADLIRNRNMDARIAKEEQDEESDIQEQPVSQKHISLFRGGLFATFIFIFFDGPQMILIFLGIGFFLNWVITLFGYLTIYIWIKYQGYSLIEAGSNKNVYLFFGSAFVDTISVLLPALTAYVIIFILSKKVEEYSSQIPGAEKALSVGAKA